MRGGTARCPFVPSFVPSFLRSFVRSFVSLATSQRSSQNPRSEEVRVTGRPRPRRIPAPLTQTLTLTTHVPSPARTTVLTVLALTNVAFERREFPRTKGRAWPGVASIIMVRSIAGKNHQKNGAEVQCAIVVVEEAIVRLAGDYLAQLSLQVETRPPCHTSLCLS